MRRRTAGDHGQATVELALGLPFVVLVLLAVLQTGLVARDQVLLVHATREAVRVAAVDHDDDAVRAAALDGSLLDPSRLSLAIGSRGEAGDRVRVDATYRCETAVPLIGPLLDDLELRANATMRVE